MGESTLALSSADLAKEVAVFARLNPDSTKWSTEESDRISRIVNAGYRNFLWPPSGFIPGWPPNYQWSFLKPVAVIEISSGTANYTLADDFGGLIGTPTFYDESTLRSIESIGEQQIRDIRQYLNTTTGRPQYCVVRPLPATDWPDGEGQRFQIGFLPIPDGTYYVSYRYHIIPTTKLDITSSTTFPYGGAIHAETIKAACRAAAEHELYDTRAEAHKDFIEKMTGSRQRDAAFNDPNTFGPNIDRAPRVWGRNSLASKSRVSGITISEEEVL